MMISYSLSLTNLFPIFTPLSLPNSPHFLLYFPTSPTTPLLVATKGKSHFFSSLYSALPPTQHQQKQKTMTELSFSNTPNMKNEFSCSHFSNLFHLCFSIFSHPLYFSYFLFFSPYLYRLLSFLSPLFITTTLLLLVALLTFTTPNHVQEMVGSELLESKLDTLLSVLHSFVGRLLSSKGDDRDEETGCLDELEAYLVTFQASIFEDAGSGSSEEASYAEFLPGEGREDFRSAEEAVEVIIPEEIPVEKVVVMEETKVIADIKSLENLFQEKEEVFCQKEEDDKEVKPVGPPEPNNVEESEGKFPLRSGSKVRDKFAKKMSGDSDVEYSVAAVKVKSQRLEETNLWSPESNWGYNGNNNQALSSNLGSFGSMRVEKEWRRTLACKLFEERHNTNGSEGMDMLWETQETEYSSNKVMQKRRNTKKGTKAEVEYSVDHEEDEDEMEGKLCCLQALKFSTGKMNLGMGRPNLVKFSKALKGIGWLHNVGRHGKKGNSSH